MMLVTHAANFVSAQLMRTLNQQNFNYLVAADDFPNRTTLSPTLRIQESLTDDALPAWLHQHHEALEFIFHLDSGEAATLDDALFQWLWELGSSQQIPLIFRATPHREAWVAQQSVQPFFWAGLSFADAFGPGDDTSDSEAWVPRAFRQLQRADDDVEHPTAPRAMVYSKDIAALAYHLVHHRMHRGFYALDAEETYTYPRVAAWVDQARRRASDPPVIPSAPPPASWSQINFQQPVFSAEAGVYDYVQNHLME